jgi:hypothetical protein
MENLLINRRELDFVKHTFYKNVFNEFGIRLVNFETKNLEEMEWDQVKTELLKRGATFVDNNDADWEQYFTVQKKKINNIKQRLEPPKEIFDVKMK